MLLWCLVLVVVLLNISDSGSYETITKTKDCDHAFSKADGKTKILTILLLLSSNNPQCAYTSTNNVSCGNACAPDNTVAVSYKELAKLCEIE